MPYIGKAPSSGIRSRFIYTATSSQTTFTGADGNGKTLGYTDGEYVDVYKNGVLLNPADYTATSKTSVVLDSGASASDIVEIVVYDTFSVFNGTFTGDLTVDSDTLFVDASENAIGIGTTTVTDAGVTITPSVTRAGNWDAKLALQSTGANDFPALLFTGSATDRYGGIVGTTDTTGNDNTTQTAQIQLLHTSDGGNLAFRTNPNIGTSTTSERMRITDNGTVLIAQTANDSGIAGHIFNANGSAFHVRDSGTVFVINRLSDDGTLVSFRQDGTQEGQISVSGTTVSYSGGHLSRWSQLTNGTKDTSIIKGTVMTNLDQMAVWSHDAVAATYYVDGDELPEGVSVGDEKTPAVDAFTEDNEQLNCMAVSSVEGDTNVAGVFVNWDNDDDDFNDMNVAMTGDMVIRIAQGTTVARGDLLMSAGDGTAKPQGDDIVRSKTVAKVISTNVSHTYDDGSYLVPCVLMAC